MTGVVQGDCIEVMQKMDAGSVDAIVTDSPYGLKFMGKAWDNGVPGVPFWIEALRVAKPGCHILAFGGTRTFHRLVCALEDAGWEIRDTLGWLYGSGFPKSHNLDDDWNGWGTALKPAWEPICLARKPLIGTVAHNVTTLGTGAINIDGCRVGAEGATKRSCQSEYPKNPDGTEDRSGSWARTGHSIESIPSGRWPANILHDGSEEVVRLFPNTGVSSGGKGDKSQNPKYTGDTVGSYLTGMRANMGGLGDSGSASRFFYVAKASKSDRDEGLEAMELQAAGGMQGRNDGSMGTITMSRNIHPTVKPTNLMRYLCRLVTPPNGLILDPFCGSGSTGKAALLEGFNFIGIELEEAYCEIARRRIEAVTQQGVLL